jgi:hypothetical protein
MQRYLKSFVSELVWIWIKIHLNPKTGISQLLFDVFARPKGFDIKPSELRLDES